MLDLLRDSNEWAVNKPAGPEPAITTLVVDIIDRDNAFIVITLIDTKNIRRSIFNLNFQWLVDSIIALWIHYVIISMWWLLSTKEIIIDDALQELQPK